MWAADVLVCPCIHVAHKEVHHAQEHHKFLPKRAGTSLNKGQDPMAASAIQTATACITMQASQSPPTLLSEDEIPQNEPIHTAGEFGDGEDC